MSVPIHSDIFRLRISRPDILKYDFDNENDIIEFIDLYPEKKIQVIDIDKRISREIEIDIDCWIVEIEDKEGRNPFHNLNC